VSRGDREGLGARGQRGQRVDVTSLGEQAGEFPTGMRVAGVRPASQSLRPPQGHARTSQA
jgi:hypothetical protein